jgi:hypothetical protein
MIWTFLIVSPRYVPNLKVGHSFDRYGLVMFSATVQLLVINKISCHSPIFSMITMTN